MHRSPAEKQRVFALPDGSPKTDPALLSNDERHFQAVIETLDRTIADLSHRLDDLRRARGGGGQAALERDLEIHRLTARLRLLQRFSVEMCLGRIVADDGTVYIGRLGLTDDAGGQLLVDWRTPAAEPFFAATPAQPMGVISRRRYRWSQGRITDYWDELLRPDEVHGPTALDAESAFIASLGSSRSARMRDVLSTIAADQDAIIRAGSRGALVVDGGPGTGKTVVALHRAAYLLYADPMLGPHRGGVLVIGPSEPYLGYVADVLPHLGEEGVRTATMRDLLPEGRTARPEADPEVERLKSTVAMVEAIEPAVQLYESLPSSGMRVETSWGDLWLGTRDWAEAFDAPEPGTPHNDARDAIWEALLDILVDKRDPDVPAEPFRAALQRNSPLLAALNAAWPLLDPADIVGDLWSVPAYLRRCAPGLSADEVRLLQRSDPQAWTVSDLPLLDAARHRLGDPGAWALRRRREAAAAREREQVSRVIDELVAADEDAEELSTMLRHPDLRSNLVDDDTVPRPDPDQLAGPFAHLIVDEAQELTDAEWQMLLLRCPSRSVTVVGDRAQARRGFAESWERRLHRVGFGHVEQRSLSINYRTPSEVREVAAPVIEAVLPDANVPTSVRSSGKPVRYAPLSRLGEILSEWLDTHTDGVGCVIGDLTFAGSERVRSLSPEAAKGLEFDLVVLVDPERWGDGVTGAVDRYVAITRATQELVILSRSS